MTRGWTDPRDGTRWIVVRRRFRHGCFGYLPAATLQLVSTTEYRVIQERPGTPPPLTDAYLVAMLDRARQRDAEPPSTDLNAS